jgi:preprotein translocase subunit SecG
MAGLAGGGNSIMSGRASANMLTRITSILAAVFIINSLVMAAVTARSGSSEKSIVDEIKIEKKETSPAVPLSGAPVKNSISPNTSDVEKPAKTDKDTSKPAVPIAE